MLNGQTMWPELGQITEKKWSQIVGIAVETVRTDSYMRLYETNRERFAKSHQHLMVSTERDYY